MKQYLAAVEAMVRSKFEQRKPDEIRAELRRLRRKFKPEKEGLQEAKKILKLVENELQDNFIVRFTKDFADEQFENLSNRFDDGVLKAVRRAMKSQNSTETAVKLVKRLGNVNKRYIDTVVQTAKGGIAQAQKIEDAKKANIKYFRYEGPIGGSRAFCANLVGKVFSLDEILAMVGQNGLPVLYFGGGWNCRHRWVAVADFKTVALEHQKRDLPFNPRDERDDTAKHASDFGLSPEEYVKEAQQVVTNSKQIYAHSFWGEAQFNYIGERGYAVVDFKGRIRGYYYHNPNGIQKAVEGNIKKKKNQWRRLL